jgi:phospholipid transport system transporter-binding protein
MTTRRKPGKAGKTSAVPRKKAAAARARAPGQRAPGQRVPGKAAAGKPASHKGAAGKHASGARTSRKSNGKSAGVQSAPAKGPATKGRAAANGSSALTPFPSDCTIAQAGDLKAQLAPLLDEPAPVILDLSEIRRIDTAALQVLTVFIRERRAAGREVECRGASDAFLVTAEVLGLRALFSPVMDDRLAAPAAGNA